MTQPGFASAGSHPPSVLVVDDEDIVRALVTRALREAGYRIMQAQHGAAAIGLLETDGDRVDLVITDLVMPGLDGREVARWAAEHRPGTPVLFISGYPKAYLEAHHLLDPSMPLLRKPFLPSRLVEAVEELLPLRPRDRRSAGDGG